MADSPDGRFSLNLGSKASFLPFLAQELGYFTDEGLDVSVLSKQQIKDLEASGVPVDVQVNWFQHAVFGVVNGKPLLTVMVLHDAPGITVMVADRLKDEIRSAADFTGRNVAEGASHSAKGILTNYLATREGLPSGSYTPVLAATEGRRENVTKGLQEGAVDVLTFMEPMTTYMKQTGMVTPIYDFGTKDSTVAEIGHPWPAESLLVAPQFAKDHPEVVQALVNAFRKTMDYVHDSTPGQVAAQLPAGYLPEKDRESAAATVSNRWPTLARGDYTVSEESAHILIEAIQAAPYDDSASGQVRAKTKDVEINLAELYTDDFVNQHSPATA